jgi:hypothetical protein
MSVAEKIRWPENYKIWKKVAEKRPENIIAIIYYRNYIIACVFCR